LGNDAVARSEALAEALERATGLKVTAAVAKSYQSLREALLDGRFDAAWAPPTLCGEAVAKGSKLVCIAVRNGTASYRSALVARVDTFIELATMEGRSAAWVDPQSMGGYLLPLAVLRKSGLDLAVALPHQRFVGSYKEALNAVVFRTADVTACYMPEGIDDPVVAWAAIVGPWAKELKVLALSPSTPNDGVCLSPALEADKVESLANAVLELPKTRLGRSALKAVECEDLLPAPPGVYETVMRLFARQQGLTGGTPAP
jgi:phosphonate transport system substrate-binding protein